MRGVFVYERYWGFNKGYMGLVPATTQGQFRQFKDNPQGQSTRAIWAIWAIQGQFGQFKDSLGNLSTIHKDTRAIHKQSKSNLNLIKKTEP